MGDEQIVFDVGSREFEERVLKASSEAPVAVDFWAEWCAPCRQLGPVLEEVVKSFGGRIRLARVDTDEHRDLAARFGIRGIPAVKIFRNGQVTAEFTGALPREHIRRILEDVVPSEADRRVEQAIEELEAGNVGTAEKLLRQALQEDPHHPAALTRLGSLLLERGENEEAREVLSRVEEHAEEYKEARGLLGGMEFRETCRQAGGAEECRARVADDPDDLEARYELGCCLAAQGSYEEAMEQFLRVLDRDRAFRDGAAREAMLRIFDLVGPKSDLARAYRKRLAAALY